MSVPMRGKRSSTDKSNESNGDKPHWVNPCPGVPTSSSGAQKRSVSEEDTGSEADFINSIVLTSKHAIYQAEKFREKYVMRTFSVDFEKHHSNWKSAKYGWLAQEVILPKELGEKLSSDNLQKMELDDESIKIYGYLQRLAVAFEQVTKDQREVNSEFQEEFAVAETHLKSILCELREIIPDSKFAIYRDANRDIMPPEFRHMDDHTYRNVRDWLIFRDYMNVVEYLIQVLEYFKTKTV
ncbi:uncharacterized protein LOC135835691 isoform X2 [Planococcus citri]